MSVSPNLNVQPEKTPSTAVWLRRFLIILTILGWIAFGWVILWGLGRIIGPITFMVFSVLIAYILYPLVKWLEHMLPRILSILIVYLGLLVIFVLFFYYVVFTAIGQLAALLVSINQNLPAIIDHMRPVVNALQKVGISPSKFQLSAQQVVNEFVSLASNIPPILGAIFGIIISIIIVASLSVYFLIDGPRVLAWLHESLPASQRGNVLFFLETTDKTMAGFLRGQLTLGVVMSVLVGGGLFLLGVPYALLLALVVFVFEFIPQVGAYISGAIIVLFALATRGWEIALIVLIYSSLVQGVLDGQILAPRIVGHAVGLHPIISLFALLVGADLFGLLGALFSAPLAGIIQILIVSYWRTWRVKHPEEFSASAQDPTPSPDSSMEKDTSRQQEHIHGKPGEATL